MNGIDNPIVFYPASIVMILFAVLAISFKNIFYSLLSAIIVFFMAGVFFYILGSEYNAVIQIMVYGLAVPVVLGLALMFTDFRENKENLKITSRLKFLVFFTSSLFLLAVVYLVLTSLAMVPDGFNVSETLGPNPVNAIAAFGNGIFSRYVWAFELISLILTIIVVGLSLFKKERGK